jgi:hypothetical protein
VIDAEEWKVSLPSWRDGSARRSVLAFLACRRAAGTADGGMTGGMCWAVTAASLGRGRQGRPQ